MNWPRYRSSSIPLILTLIIVRKHQRLALEFTAAILVGRQEAITRLQKQS